MNIKKDQIGLIKTKTFKNEKYSTWSWKLWLSRLDNTWKNELEVDLKRLHRYREMEIKERG